MTTFSETTNARFIQKSECNIQGKALPRQVSQAFTHTMPFGTFDEKYIIISKEKQCQNKLYQEDKSKIDLKKINKRIYV